MYQSLSNIISKEFNRTTCNENDFIAIRCIQHKQKQYCTNCGYNGHNWKRCQAPTASYGIIHLNIDKLELDTAFKNKYIINNVKEKHKHRDNNYQIKKIAITHFNIKNDNQLASDHVLENLLELVENKVKVLLICRKNTVGYIDFIKGKYSESSQEEIINLLNQFTPCELDLIANNNFDMLWSNLWNGKYDSVFTESIKEDKLKKDYVCSKIKFEIIQDNGLLQECIAASKLSYDMPEWGFPKGRRNCHESDFSCAKREFLEETQLNNDSLFILDRIHPIAEKFVGTNSVNYEHNYFISIGPVDDVGIIDSKQALEIGNIRWVSLKEAKQLIRPYHTERLRILNEIIKFIAHNLHFYSNNLFV